MLFRAAQLRCRCGRLSGHTDVARRRSSTAPTSLKVLTLNALERPVDLEVPVNNAEHLADTRSPAGVSDVGATDAAQPLRSSDGSVASGEDWKRVIKHRRSAYAILRSRDSLVDVCARGIPGPCSHPLSAAETPDSSNIRGGKGGTEGSSAIGQPQHPRAPWWSGVCCCSALVYPVPPGSRCPREPFETSEGGMKERKPSSSSDASSSLRDDFLLAVHVSSTMEAVADLVGDQLQRRLLFPDDSPTFYAGLCGSEALWRKPPSSTSGSDGCSPEASPAYVARLLLSSEEENRVEWWFEDGMSMAALSRMPSFRALYVTLARYASQSRSAAGPPRENPRLVELTKLWTRIRSTGKGLLLSDIAALFAVTAEDRELHPLLYQVLSAHLQTISSPREPSEADPGPNPYSDLFLAVLLTLLLRFESSLSSTGVPRCGPTMRHPPAHFFEFIRAFFTHFADRLSGRAVLPWRINDVEDALVRAAGILKRAVGDALVTWSVSAESDALQPFLVLLLTENCTSDACRDHLRKMIARSSDLAMAALEASGILSPQRPDLHKIVHQLLPLVDACGSEEFFNAIIRDMIVALERRSRADVFSFTTDELRLLAILGTRIYGSAGDITMDVGPREEAGPPSMEQGTSTRPTSLTHFHHEQWQELQVMDGSPWALVKFMGRSLQEIVRTLLIDHNRLRQHVRSQVMSMTADFLPSSCEGNFTAPEQAPCHDTAVNPGAFAAGTGLGSPPGAKPPLSFVPGAAVTAGAPFIVPSALRHRYLVFVENLVKKLVDETSQNPSKSVVVCTELFTFLHRYVPIPNIHDDYRRKLFLLVNVVAASDANDENHVPAELRELVALLPLTLSPWASVMILREVLSESAGNNPRYLYVLNAALDLQLPISTTRSRIATTLNMWRFLSSQSHKMRLLERTAMKQRCVLNLPLSYVMSSYWSLLWWSFLASIIGLNIVGLDFESQFVAATLYRQFHPPPELLAAPPEDPRVHNACEELAAVYFQSDLSHTDIVRENAASLLLSSASYMFLGRDKQRRPMTVISVGSASQSSTVEEEFACASALLRKLPACLSFPMYVDIDSPLSIELIIARVADRIRRVSFNNAGTVRRMVFRTFPLGRSYTENTLVQHTCAQANLTRRRVTFLLYLRDTVPVSPDFMDQLGKSVLAQHANLVVIVHERSLAKGGAGSQLHRAPQSGEEPSPADASQGEMQFLAFCSYFSRGAEPSSVLGRRFDIVGADKAIELVAKAWGTWMPIVCQWFEQRTGGLLHLARASTHWLPSKRAAV